MTMMANREFKTLAVSPPILGMNTNDPAHRMPQGQGLEAWNVDIDEVMGINKRGGYSAFNTASFGVPRYTGGTVKEITGVMVYFSGATLTASVCAASDMFFMKGNSSAIFWQIAGLIGTNTLSLAVAYTQTVTASTYVLSPKELGNMYDFKYGSVQKLIAFAGSDGFIATPGSTGSFTAITAGLTDYSPVAAITFQDKLYFCNGYQFKNYDGTNVASVSGSPDPSDPKFVSIYTIGNANWLWIGGSNSDADKSQFAFCDVNAPGTWPAANVYYAGDRDGGVITGGLSFPGGFAVYKDNGIFAFTGIPGSGTFRKIVNDVGCIAPWSLKSDKGVHYFLGRRSGKIGVFRFDGTPNIVKLSESIEPTLTALNIGQIVRFKAEIYDNKYVIGVRTSGGSYNDEHYICYIDRPFQYLNTNYFPWVRGDRSWNSLLTVMASGITYLYSGSATNGIIYREDTGNTNDTTDNFLGNTSAINAYVDTGWLDFGDNSRQKELRYIYIDSTESGDWELNFSIFKNLSTVGSDNYSINLGASVMTWNDVVYGTTAWQTAADKAIHELQIRYPCIAKHFKFRWANADASEPFSVYPVNCYFKTEQR